ncbi:MAG: BspA family leucine-rich repeat surface protein [Cytophagia bacterium]|nr:MAG: BspA family leucine-rich repeat surface protein [Cytophagia bacterium]
MGQTTSQAGPWGAGSTWVGGTVPISGATVTIAHNVTITSTISDIGTLTINAGVTLNPQGNNITVTGTTTVNGTFIDNVAGGTNTFGVINVISGGSFTASGGVSSFSFGGNITNAGTFNINISNYSFVTNLSITNSSASNMTFNAGTAGQATATINSSISVTVLSSIGDVELLDGDGINIIGTLANSNDGGPGAPTTTSNLIGTGTFINNPNGYLNYVGNAAPTVTNFNVSAGGSTFWYNGSGNHNIRAATYHKLRLSNNRTLSLTAPLTVNENLELLNNVILDVVNATYTVDIKGILNVGGSSNILHRNGTFTFTGANANTGFVTTESVTLYNVVINKTASTDGVAFNNFITILNTLTLTRGLMYINNNNLTLSNPTASNQILPITPTSISYIVINNPTSTFIRNNLLSNNPYIFPVGIGATYNPLSITPSANTDIKLRLLSTGTPSLPSTTANLNVQWGVSSSVAITANSVQMNWQAANVTGTITGASSRFYNGTSWVSQGGSAIGTQVTSPLGATLPMNTERFFTVFILSAKTASASGNWNNPAIWSPVGVPLTGDDVIITGSGTIITVDIASVIVNNLAINNGATLNVGTFSPIIATLSSNGNSINTFRMSTVAGASNITNASHFRNAFVTNNTVVWFDGGNYTIPLNLGNTGTGYPDVWINGGTKTLPTTGTFITKNLVINAGALQGAGSANTLNIGGELEVKTGTTFSNLGYVNINLSSNLIVNGTFTLSTGTAFSFSAGTAAVTISGVTNPINFGNAAVTVTNNKTVTNNATNSITMGGTLTLGTTASVFNNNKTLSLTGNLTGGTFNNNAGATLNYASANAPTSTCNFTAVPNTVHYNGAINQNIGLISTFNNIQFSGGSNKDFGIFPVSITGDWTNNGATIITGVTSTITFANTTTAQTIGGSSTSAFNNLTINNTNVGGVDIGTTTVTGTNTLTIAANALLRVGASNFPSGFGTYTLNTTSTVVYYATIPQDIRNNITYGNLLLVGNNVKNLTGNFTVATNLLLSGSSTAMVFGGVAKTVTVNRDVSGNGTIDLSSATHTLELRGENNAIGTLITGTSGSLVRYNRQLGTQQIIGTTYQNLEFVTQTSIADKIMTGVITLNTGGTVFTLGNNNKINQNDFDFNISQAVFNASQASFNTNVNSWFYNNTLSPQAYFNVTNNNGAAIVPDVTIPIGSPVSAMHITLFNYSVTETPDLKFTVQEQGINSFPTIAGNPYVKYVWNILTTGTATISSLTFNWTAISETSLLSSGSLYRHNGTNWAAPLASYSSGFNIPYSASPDFGTYGVFVPLAGTTYYSRDDATNISTTGADWASGTWSSTGHDGSSCGCVPNAGDNVIIKAGHRVNITTTILVNITNLEVNGVLDFGNNTTALNPISNLQGTGRLRFTSTSSPITLPTITTNNFTDGTVEFYTGTNGYEIPPTFGAVNYPNLEINAAVQTITLPVSGGLGCIVNKNFKITAGTFNPLERNITVEGTTIIDGSFTDTNNTNFHTFKDNITVGSSGTFSSQSQVNISPAVNMSVVNNSASPMSFGLSLQINSDNAITFDGNMDFAGNFEVNSSNTPTINFAGDATKTYNILGNLIIQNTIINNSGTLSITGNVNSTGATFNNLTNAYLKLSGNFAPDFFNASAVGNTVEYNGSSGQTILPATYYHLVLTGTGSKALTDQIFVLGDFTNDLTLPDIFDSNNFPVHFNGTAVTQTIGGTAVTDFTRLVINKSSGNIILGQSVNVSDQLNLMSGKVLLGEYNFSYSGFEPNLSISANSYVVTNGSAGNFNRVNFIPFSEHLFPIGIEIASNTYTYTPVKVIYSTVPVGNISVRAAKPNTLSLPNFNATEKIDAVWRIQQGADASIALLKFGWEVANEVSFNAGTAKIIQNFNSVRPTSIGTQEATSSGVTQFANTTNTFAVFSATTYTSVQSGNWNDGGTWVGGIAPSSPTDNVIIQQNHIVTIPPSSNINVANLTLVDGDALNNGGRLNVAPSGSNNFFTIGTLSVGNKAVLQFSGSWDGPPSINTLTAPSGGSTIRVGGADLIPSITNIGTYDNTNKVVFYGSNYNIPEKLSAITNFQNVEIEGVGIGSFEFGGMTIDNDFTVLSAPASFNGVGDALTINKDFVINSGGSFDPQAINLTVSGISTIDGTFNDTNAAGTNTFKNNITVGSSGSFTSTSNVVLNPLSNLNVLNSSASPINFTGGVEIGSGSPTINFDGNMNFGASLFTPSGSGTPLLNFNGSSNIYNLTNTPASITLNTGTINNNATMNVAGNITTDGSSIFNNNGGSYLKLGGSFGITLSASTPSNTVEYASGFPQNIVTTAYQNLVISDNTVTKTLSGNITVAGDFTNNVGANFLANSNKVTFNGTTPQTISGATTFFDLEINNTATLPAIPTVTLQDNTTVFRSLTLTAGKLITSANTLQLSGTSYATQLLGTPFSSSKYIVTSAGGQFNRLNVDATIGNVEFPIGATTSDYTPLTFTNTGNFGSVGVSVRDEANTITESPKVNRIWNIATSGATNPNIKFDWNVSNQSATLPFNAKIHQNSSAWTNTGIITTYTAGTQTASAIISAGNSGNRDFAMFTPAPVPIIVINPNPVVTAGNILKETTDNILYQFSTVVTSLDATLTELKLTTGGTYATADITNLKLRYSTDNILDVGDATFATITPATAGVQTFTGLPSITIPVGTGYFFVTADVGGGAANGNTISIIAPAITDFTFATGNTSFFSAVSNGGLQTITPIPTQPLGNRGLYFDGQNDYVNIGNVLGTTFQTEFTAEAWIKPTRTGTNRQNVIFSKWSVGNNASDILFSHLENSGNSLLFFSDADGTNITTPLNSITFNKWSHVALVYKQTPRSYAIYIDGVLQASGTDNNLLITNTNTFPLRIGAIFNGGLPQDVFTGQIDEVRIFSSVRDASQIQLDMSTQTPNGASAYWNFDDDAAAGVQTQAVDIAGSNNGTLQNGALWAMRVTDNTDTGSAGLGSLRQAITEANTDTDKDYIDFSIDNITPTLRTITLGGALPNISNPVFVDGFSALGSDTQLRIDINGNSNNIFDVNANNSTLQGLIMRNGATAVNINSVSSANKISQNNIFSNTTAINLNGTGNGSKSAPFITSATTSFITGTGVTGDIIEIFENNPLETQGRTYKGQTTVIAGTWGFVGTFTLANAITSTATDVTNGTSAFSTPQSAVVSNPFRTTWITTDTQILIPTRAASGAYNYGVSWRNLTNPGVQEGNSIIGQTADYTITGLQNNSVYQIDIIGTFPHFYMDNNATNRTKLRTIEQWGDIAWASMQNSFWGCSNLTYTATDIPILSPANNMQGMFRDCSAFNGNISSWNVSNVTSMQGMFNGASVFNRDISSWNVSNVTSFDGMFQFASAFNQDLSNWNFSTISNISALSMFYGAGAFNNGGVILNWGTKTTRFTNMANMFAFAGSFNQDISSWNVNNVTTMANMFENAIAFNQSLATWQLRTLGVNMTDMLNNCGMNTANYDATLIGWAGQAGAPTGVTLGATSRIYCTAINARNTLTNSKGWTISNDAISPACLPTQPLGNRGIYLNGGTEHIVANTPSTATDNFTVEAWVKLSRVGGQIIRNGLGYSMFIDGNGRFMVELIGIGYIQTDYIITLNRWTHLAIVRNGGIWAYYADGVVLNRIAGPANTTPPNPPSVNLFIGERSDITYGYYQGQVDEVRIFNVARTQAQIQLDMATQTPNGAAAYWNFDDDATTGVQTQAVDIVGGNNGTLQNGALWALRVTDDTDNGSAGLGSLRQAITEANTDTDTDYIDFSIQQANTSTVSTIALTSVLPNISEPVLLDGYSAYGSSPNSNLFNAGNNAQLRVEINAAGIGSGANPPNHAALTLNSASNSTIKGLSIYGVPSNSGNQSTIRLNGTTTNTSIEGCYIGLRTNGFTPATNMNGVEMAGTVGGNILGWSGTINPASFNIISNSNFTGVVTGSNNNIIQGNYIGTDITGTIARPNAQRGIALGATGTGNQVLNNLISGNGSLGGLYIRASGTIVRGNLIGTTANGIGSLPNMSNGITITGNITSAANNVIIGGTLAGEANIIANNSGAGVLIEGGSFGAINNRVSGNNIYNNTSGGISLAGSLNIGNNDKVAPSISAATPTSVSGFGITGDVIEVFENNPLETQGRIYKGTTTAASGVWSLTGTFTVGSNITATATDNTNGTSRFSPSFFFGGTYYSITNGNWNAPGTWSTDNILKHLGASCNCTPNDNAIVNIGAHTISVTGQTDIKLNNTINLTSGNSVLDFSNSTTGLSNIITDLNCTTSGAKVMSSQTLLPTVTTNNFLVPSNNGLVEFYGSSTYDIPNKFGTLDFNNVIISGTSGSKNLATPMIINGNLELRTNSVLNVLTGGAITTSGTNKTFKQVINTIFTTATTYPAGFTNYDLHPNSTFGYTALTGTQNVKALSGTGLNRYGNLDIVGNSGSIKALEGDVNVAGNLTTNNATINFGNTTARTLTITGDLINANGTIDMSGGTSLAHTLNLNGTNNAITTYTTGANTAAKVVYGGTTQQVFASPNYQNLEIAGSNIKTLQGNATVNNTLTLASGILRLGTNTLTITNNAANAIVGGNTSSYIETNGSGGLTRNITSATTYNFPVGGGTTPQYAPASLTYATIANDIVFVRVGEQNTNGLPQLPAGFLNNVPIVWAINSSQNVTNLSLNWQNPSVAATTIKEYVSSWDNALPLLNNSASGTSGSVTNITGLGGTTKYFSVFSLPTIVVSPSALSAFTSCAGTASTEQTYTVSGTNLATDIVINAPTGFQISTTTGTGFANSLNLTPTSGNVANTTIYVRQITSATNGASGNIAHTSTNATTQNVSIPTSTVNPLPTPTIIGNNAVCANSSEIYSVTNVVGNTYIWTITGGTIDSGQNTNSISVTWGTAGVRTVQVVEIVTATSCAIAVAQNIVINALPTSTIIGNNIVCANSPQIYSVTNVVGNIYSWTITGGVISNGQGTNTIDVIWGVTGIGNVSVLETITATGCLATTNQNITINALPTPTIAGNNIVCANSSQIYSVTNVVGNAYLWTITGGIINSGQGTNEINVTWDIAGAGTLQLTETITTTGCSSVSPNTNITINALPTPTITGNNAVCANSSQIYSVLNVVGNTYLWTITGGTIDSGQGTNQINVTWGIAGAGTLQLTETITTTGCSSVSPNTNITINALPTPTIIGNNIICANSSQNYSVTNVVGSTYFWTITGGIINSGQNTNSISVIWGTAGIGAIQLVETVTATNCETTTSQNITINLLPTPSITGNLSILRGSTQTYNATGTGNIYVWNVTNGTITTGQGTNTISVTWGTSPASGTIQLTETNSNNCINIANISVELLNNNPVITQGTLFNIITLEDNSNSFSLNATDIDSNTPFTNFDWSISTQPTKGNVVVNTNNTNIPSFTYTPNLNENGTDTFNVTLLDGEGGTATITINVNITPVNDIPVLISQSPAILPNMTLTSPIATLSLNFATGPANEATQRFIQANVTSSNPAILEIVSATPTPALNTTAGNMTLNIQYRVNQTAIVTNPAQATINFSVRDDGGVANGGIDTYNGSVAVKIDPMLPAPTNFSATALSGSSTRLTWDAFPLVTGTGFEIQRDLSDAFANATTILNTTNNTLITFDDTNIGAGLYYYRIRAKVSNGTTLWSQASLVVIGQAVVNVPTNLQANSITFNKITLTWTDNSVDETSFDVERASIFTNNQFTRIASVGAMLGAGNTVTYIDEDVFAFFEYRYRVRARSFVGISPYSNSINIITSIDPNASPTTPPFALQAQALSKRQIDLVWRYNNISSQIRFEIERANGNSAPYVRVGTIFNTAVIGDRSFSDTLNLVEGQLYCYRVRAVSAGGYSDYSNISCADAVCNLGSIAVLRDDVGTGNTTVCAGKSAALILTKRPFGARYQWHKNGEPIAGAIFSTYLANATGKYKCYISVGTGLGLCADSTFNNILIIAQGTATPVTITYEDSKLKASIRDANTYQWFKNYVPIPSATLPEYPTTENGTYFVIMTIDGCASTSNLFIVGDPNALESFDVSNYLSIYPNPTSDKAKAIINLPIQGEYEWTITDVNGKIITQYKGQKTDIELSELLDLTNVANGMYFVEWRTGKYQARKKIIKR